jgi:long-chain acyl-CoA synthetase
MMSSKAVARLEIGPGSDTVPKIFWQRVQEFGQKIAFRDKNFGVWEPITWKTYGDKAREVGLGLLALGLSEGGRVSITSEVCPEWLMVDMGVMGVGGVSFGVYPTDTAPQVEYIMSDCDAEFYFAEDEEQLDKILEVRDQLPKLKMIFVFDNEGLHDFTDDGVMTFDALLAIGKEQVKASPSSWLRRVEATKANDVAILVYTSGTTGPPKGAMITHDNIVFQMANNQDLLPYEQTDRTLAFLPLCHIAERTFTTFNQLVAGQTVNFAENFDTVPENLQEIQPSSFFAVPRIWEKFYSTITIMVKDATPVQKLAYNLAIGIGQQVADKKIAEKRVPILLKGLFAVADFAVLKNIRKMIGVDNCKFCLSGAAPVSPELIRWYWALGLYMAEGFGQTENSGLATLPIPFGTYRFGRVGRALPNTEVVISEKGEILIKGRHVFRGYWNQPEKTAETVVDGWLHTGDVGNIDDEGWLKITDRMKDIIITAGGKNITPSEIENELKFSPYIQDAVVIGDARPYLVALFMIDYENVAKFAQDENIPFSNFASLCRAEEVLDLIQSEMNEVNKKFARVEQVKKFRLIEHEITPEDDEVTATGKLKRSFVNEKYKDLIDDMYNS